MSQSMPTRQELANKIDGLCTGSESREGISEWAVAFIEDDSIRVTDEIVWSILENLGAADLPAVDRDYLYTIEDFKAWKFELLSD